MLVDTWELPHRHVGQRVEVFDCLESTNDLALQRSRDPASAGLALLAQEQSAGRGQFGRSWQAPPGSSVLLSVVLFPPPSLRRPALLTAWAAVSVCDVISQSTDLQPRIKWPNDVLLAGKKVCGILIEQRTGGTLVDAAGTPHAASERGPAAVAGIGLNVRQESAFFASLPLAGSLFSLTGLLFDTADLARRLLRRLDEHFASLVMGEITPLETHWRQRLGLAGQNVRMELDGGWQEGRLHEIAFAGLVLEQQDGVFRHLQPEAVRHLQSCVVDPTQAPG